MADDGDPEHDEASAPRDEADPAGSHDDSDRFSDLDFTSAFMLCAREPFENWVRGVEGHGRDWTLPPIARCSAYVTPELPGKLTRTTGCTRLRRAVRTAAGTVGG